MVKEKEQKDKQRSTKHTHKTKDREMEQLLSLNWVNTCLQQMMNDEHDTSYMYTTTCVGISLIKSILISSV